MTNSFPDTTPTTPRNLIDRTTWQTEIAQSKGIGTTALSNLMPPHGINEAPSNEQQIVVQQLALDHYYDKKQEFEGKFIERAMGDDFNEFYVQFVPEILRQRQKELEDSESKFKQIWTDAVFLMKAGVQSGIDTGYLPPEIGPRLERAESLVSARVVDDLFMSNTIGSYDSNTDTISISHMNINGIHEYPDETIVHELVHQIAGGTYIKNVEDNGVIRPRTGFSNDLIHGRMSKTGINEAVTQHLTMGIETGDFATLDPDARTDDDKTYYEYRKVLAGFVDQSGGVIDVKTMIRAYFEETGPSGTMSARREFVRQSITAYGPGALNKLEKVCEAAYMIPEEKVAEFLSTVLHPPVVNEQGDVIKAGYLDMSQVDFMSISKYFPVK